MTTTRVSERLDRVREALAQQSADWLVVPASADFRWLTGARARSTERLVALALPVQGEPFAIVPGLESEMLEQEAPGLELEVWSESEDPLERLLRRMQLRPQSVVLVGEGMRVAALLRLAAQARCRPASDALAALRARKDADELDALQRAAAHADLVVEELADRIETGASERELGQAAIERFQSLGDDQAWVIVASGPNSALPHHFTSDRKIGANEAVLLDLGAFTDGYASDITRTFWTGTPPAEFVKVFETVNAARAAAIAAVKPGVTAEAVDHAARAVIERVGYGPQFVHRTGHGVGLEVHELPYLVAGNREPLRSGMVHSVEPGVYLPGRFGVRIEDLVVVEDHGARRLNTAPIDPRPRRMRS